MEKKNDFFLIKDVLKNAVNDRNYRENFKIFLLKKKWFDIIGKKLFPYTMPSKIYKKCLYVNCSHQGWIQTLQFYKKDVLESIKKNYKDELIFDDIIFILGKVNNFDIIEKKEREENNKIDFVFKDDNISENFITFFNLCNKKIKKNLEKTNT